MLTRTALILVCCFYPIVGHTQAGDLDTYVQHEMEARSIPALAFAIIDHGKTVAMRAYGTANLETGTPLDLNGVFELASVTKPLTATAVMMLVEDGKLGLDDHISGFLENAPAGWKAITVRQLLSHTSGLRGGGWIECAGAPLLRMTTRQRYEDIAKSSPQYAPGEEASYSDPGYFLLGMIIEKVSNMRYSDFMQQRMFAPIGMTSTRVEDRRTIVKNHVSEYTLRGDQLENERRVWQNELPSSYGVWSTVSDLVKWNAALEQGRLLNADSLAQMWTPTKLKNGQVALVDGMQYGLGWFILDIDGHRVVGHPGFLGSVMFHVVDQQLTIILLTNRDVEGGSFQAKLAQDILSRFRPDLPRFLPE